MIDFFRRALLADYVEDPVTRANARTSLIDGMLYSVMAGLLLPLAALYPLALGAGDYVVGLVASLPALAAALAQLVAGFIVEAVPSRLAVTRAAAFIHRAFFLVFAALAVAPIEPRLAAWLFVILYAVQNAPGTIAGVAWIAMMGDMFPAAVRGRIFGDRNMLCGLVSLLATAAAGLWLDRVPFPANWAWLFGASFAFTMASLHYLGKLKEPPRVAARAQGAIPAAHPGERPWARVRPADLLLPWRTRAFAAFAGGQFVMHIGLNLPATVMTLLFVRHLGLPASWIGMFATLAGAAQVATYPAWGRFADRRGQWLALRWANWGVVPFALVFAYTGSPYAISALHLAAGAAGAGWMLTTFNMLLEVSPEDGRPHYIAAYWMAAALATFVAPLAGVWIYTHFGVWTTLFCATAVRAAAALYMDRALPPRPAAPAPATAAPADPAR